MRRRKLLKAMTATPLLSSPLFAGSSSKPARRKGVGAKKLVVCFQRGGCDGLNTMVPVDPGQYGYYTNLRPDLGLSQSLLLNVAGNGFFALHPSLQPLVPHINAGNCSMIHAVGYPNPDRSHFKSQSYLETAVPGMDLIDGWLNRYLSATTGPGLIRGISIGSNIPQSVTGPMPVPVSTNFGLTEVMVDKRLNPQEADGYRQSLKDLLALPSTPGNTSIYDTGNNAILMIENFRNRNLSTYTPENGASYALSVFGDAVKHAAQMLKDDTEFLGVEVVVLDQGGYDTHSNQLNPSDPVNPDHGQAFQLAELAKSMAAFYQDMGPTRMGDIVFLVISEFGRRAYQNLSFGTAHGTGSVAFVMGNPVGAGLLNGGANWPGLHSNDLFEASDLNWVTDFRDIYWEILSEHMGLDPATLATVIPGHAYVSQGILS